ncbi:MAG: methyltransferase [Bacteroidota bacterium]
MSTFRFKQFEIHQDKTSMKVGTDGVLLGAWTNVSNSVNALDIGSGTGLISLMLAQRSKAYITAIEIEENAYIQTGENFNNSKWNNRLKIEHSSLQNFSPKNKFDLIVSNPPFFNNSHKTPNENRNLARHTDSLNYSELLTFTSVNLDSNGKASFIIPNDSEKEFLQLAEQKKLYPNRITRVKGNGNSPVKRSLIELNFQKNICMENLLTIEISRHIYTQDYIDLTKDFYLKM